jgi:hypothetical protein
MAALFYTFIMAYKVKQGFEKTRLSVKINGEKGTRLFNGHLGDASQEDLKIMHHMGIPHIEQVAAKPKKKKRAKASKPPTPENDSNEINDAE